MNGRILAQGVGKGYPKINKHMKKKTQTRNTNIISIYLFLKCGAIFSKRRAQRVDVYCGIMNTSYKKCYIQNSTKKNRRTNAPISIEQMTFLKNIGFQRHSNYYGFRRSGVAARSGPVGSGGWFWALAWAKRWSKGCLFLTLKIENGTRIKLFMKGRHLDPLKTLPGGGLKKH